MKVVITGGSGLVGNNLKKYLPNEVYISSKDFFIKNSNKYDVILTHNQKVLDKCSNAELFEFGSCWISELCETKNKNFELCKPFLHFHKRINDKIEEIVNSYD